MEKKLLIEGMSCNHCVNHLKTALTEDIEGVSVKEVNLEGKYAIVEMKEDINLDELKNVIGELDFELVGIE
ncbi:MAG: heavy-metal-associated domain-containing protein [Peptostreptococcaceae bacterium]